MDDKIQIAQDRKGASIAFFSATNNATAIYAALPSTSPIKKQGTPLEVIRSIREELLADYNVYYTNTLKNVGKLIQGKELDEVIDRIKSIEDTASLRSLYLSLRQELRDNNTIRLAVDRKKTELK